MTKLSQRAQEHDFSGGLHGGSLLQTGSVGTIGLVIFSLSTLTSAVRLATHPPCSQNEPTQPDINLHHIEISK